jgi:hypothetical protein
MDRDARKMRGDRPFLFTNLRAGEGVAELTEWVHDQMSQPHESRRTVVTMKDLAERPARHSHSHAH